MKHLKIFEKYNDTPKIGDWVLCNEDNSAHDVDDPNLTLFINNNIGKIVSNEDINGINSENYVVEYSNVPENIEDRFFSDDMDEMGEYIGIFNKRTMYLEEIKYWSDNIEDLELKISTNIYNL